MALKYISINYMKSREFKKIYHPSLGRYVYEHRGNGLIVDNIMKPLKSVKGAISTAATRLEEQ